MHGESFTWPNFFIVGASKCGTTSVWAYLKTHPQIFLPEMKEPSFFVSALPRPGLEDYQCTGNLQVYKSLYKNAKGYIAIGDASTPYLWDRNVPSRIHEVSPQARIVILLRDPIERAYSQYRMLARVGTDPLPFHEAIKRDNSESVRNNNWWNQYMYIERSLYYEQVLRYIETFGRGQVGIYLFEDLVKDPSKVLSAICRHIGVDPSLLDAKATKRIYNTDREPRVKWLYNAARVSVSEKIRKKILPLKWREWLRHSPFLYRRYRAPRDERATKYLQTIYEPDLCRLEELLGRKLPELRSTWV